jgi:cell division topological specificity factor
MLDFITRFFKREETSKTLAKERLRLVLMSDRVSLAPEIFDEMKGEMLAVIRRYLEIDERALDMHFESLERQFALLASIPVLKVKTRDQDGLWNSREPVAQHADTAAPGTATATNGSAVHAAASNGAAAAVQAQNGQPPRRRRRRRRAAAQPPPADPPMNL